MNNAIIFSQEENFWEVHMRRPKSLPEGVAERLKLLLKQAKSKSEFQRIQAVYLRVATPMTPEEIAAALAWHPGTVRNIHSAFLRNGEEAFQVSLRGGRHRENLSVAEEDDLLDQFLAAAGDGGVIVVSGIKAAYEQKLGQSVPKSTVYRMLARHDWRQIVPRPRHPKSDIAAQEAFKKTSRKSSRSK
jgi:transposase